MANAATVTKRAAGIIDKISVTQEPSYSQYNDEPLSLM